MAKKKTLSELTLDDLKTVFRNTVRTVVHDELVPIDFRLTNLKSEFRLMKVSFEGRFDWMATGVDKLLGVRVNHAEEHTANQSAHDRFEQRIGRLEKQKYSNVSYA
jgi:hypothetical protein